MRNPLFTVCHYLLLGLLTACCHPVRGQNAVVDVKEEFSFLKNQLDSTWMAIEDAPGYFLVRRLSISDSDGFGNIEVVRSLTDGYHIVWAHPQNLLQASEDEGIWRVDNSWKLSPNLRKAVDLSGEFFISSSDIEKVQTRLKNCGQLKPAILPNETLMVQADLKEIKEIVLPMQEVRFVSMESVEAKHESPVLDLNLTPNRVNKLKHERPDLDGTDLNISIREFGFDPMDIDLVARSFVTSVTSQDTSLHATEMATLISGAGNSFITGSGVSPASNFSSADFGDLFANSASYYKDFEVSVQNHSYGTGIENFYGSLARSYDQASMESPDVLHVFSSGNDGQSSDTVGTYAGLSSWANLTGNFKMAKNVLVVGAVDTVGRVLEFSSRGPAYDGRVKPDVVAYSAVGASNSAAIVSGLAVLLQQEYRSIYGELPTAALLRSVIINSATDLGSTGPDFVSGYGNVNATAAAGTITNGNFRLDSVQQGETDLFVIQVPPNSQDLKVTIVWNDAPATLNASSALVNDLDMEIVDPDNAVWLPWTLDHSPDSAALATPAVRGADRLNTVEQITIKSPVAGPTAIRVTGTSITSGAQPYAIAFQWQQKDHFSWSFPTGSDNVPYNGEAGSYLRWESTLASEMGNIELSLDDGTTWSSLATGVELDIGHFRWLPEGITSSAILRMVVDGNEYPTDPFSISTPPAISTGFNCADSVLLTWSGHENFSEYRVLRLDGQYMQPWMTVADTSLVFNKSEINSAFVAVQPAFSNGIEGIRSVALEFDQMQSGCFLASFFTDLAPDEGIYLHLQLTTNYGVDRVEFERMGNAGFDLLGSAMSPDSVNVSFLDSEPLQGRNRHRARIHLINGQEILTDTIDTYFVDQPPFLVFPNPVPQTVPLNLYSREFDGERVLFTLVDRSGAKILDYELSSDRDFVSLFGLRPGLYFYILETSSGIRQTGKLVISAGF